MKKVFVNGYGTIGSRISKFLADDNEVELFGIGKHSPDDKVKEAISMGFSVYAPKDKVSEFDRHDVSGTIEEAVEKCDLILDCSPGGKGFENKKKLYEPKNCRVIFQGGEKITGEKAVSELLFNSRVNYEHAFNKQFVMQGSCNVTGMGRILQPLREHFGNSIVRFDVTLLRRWADIEDTKTTLKDTIEWTFKPHHDQDVKSYMGKDIPLYIRVFKVPTRQMHLHLFDIRFQDESELLTNNDGKNFGPTTIRNDFINLFKKEYGVTVLYGAKGIKDIRDFAETLDYNFKDTNMIHIHADLLEIQGDVLKLTYSDDQTGIVVPENHILMQAMLFQKKYKEALKHTEEVFHMEEKKRKLQDHFAKTDQ